MPGMERVDCGPGGVVVKVSGSLVYPPSSEYLGALRDAAGLLVERCGRLGLVVGGGPLAREAIEALKPLGLGLSVLDIAGIRASRFNAFLVAASLHPLAPLRVPESVEEALDLLSGWRAVVMGGLQPGQSTNAVAASLAEAMGASVLVNLLKGIDGVYYPAPGVPGSRRLERASYSDLRRVIEDLSQTPGGYALFDAVALNIVERSEIKIIFMDGGDPRRIPEALDGAGAFTLVGPGRG